MRNGLARHVKTNIKDRVKQKTGYGKIATGYGLHNADCCYYCKHRGVLYGHYSDAIECSKVDATVPHVSVCDLFERREE